MSSAFALLLLAARIVITREVDYAFLVWNLFLAWMPYLLSLWAATIQRRRPRDWWRLLIPGALWLLFFPNAPYIVTDAKYLAGSTGREFWYDGLLIGTAATTGLLLGFVSLYLIHAIVRRGAGARAAWFFVFGVLGLSSFGIYLGRVLRWNSWDVFVRPGTLVAHISRALLDPLAHPRPIAMTVLFTAFLGASYLLFYTLARATSLLPDYD
jgi:uncharacterized membrane protein